MFEKLCKSSSDINEHLPTLRDLATDCKHVTEMGVRYIVSTWAFIEGNPKTLVSIDIKHPSYYGGDISEVERVCTEKGIDFTFIESDSRKVKLNKTDLLFIDTDHTYELLKEELSLHGGNVKKYIVLHDTVSCKDEIMPAIEEFLAKGVWKVYKHYENNNGLMVLSKC